jgi:hypothetical protein
MPPCQLICMLRALAVRDSNRNPTTDPACSVPCSARHRPQANFLRRGHAVRKDFAHVGTMIARLPGRYPCTAVGL